MSAGMATVGLHSSLEGHATLSHPPVQDTVNIRTLLIALF
jgi:hypothetical protein